MRYEIKYAIPILDRHMVEQIVLSHPASFTTAFPDRIIHNIYYDDATLFSFYQNVDGQPNRKKVRHRWYNDNDPSEGQIEIKIKKGVVGYKEFIPLDEELTIEALIATRTGASLQPTLSNQYLRSYYISADAKFRLTIDRDIIYRHPTEPLIVGEETQHIIEIKFEQEDYKLFDNIHRYIPLRQTKYSKYVNGVLKIRS